MRARFLVVALALGGCQDHRGSLPTVAISEVSVVEDHVTNGGQGNGVLDPGDQALVDVSIVNLGTEPLAGFAVDMQVIGYGVTTTNGECTLFCDGGANLGACERTSDISCECELPSDDPAEVCRRFALEPDASHKVIRIPVELGTETSSKLEFLFTFRDADGAEWIGEHELEVTEPPDAD